MGTRKPSGEAGTSPTRSPRPLEEQQETLRRLRRQLIAQYRPVLQQGAGPIRVMARIAKELEEQCRRESLAEEVIKAGVVNRTIGDVNLRLVTECEGAPGGPGDYRLLADELGVALPGEVLAGHNATRQTYLWLRDQMQEWERVLLREGIDLRIYDVFGVGNPVLRGWLGDEMRRWGLSFTAEQVYLGLGAMDCIDKVLRGLIHRYREQQVSEVAVLFPTPGFAVPEWQARSYGYRVHHFWAHPEDSFKITAAHLDAALQQAPDIRVLYLMVTNNPTTFAFTAAEVEAIQAVLRKHLAEGREIYVLADLAYVGTGRPEDDRARMAAFAVPDLLPYTLFVNSFSKTYSLTGERFGWVCMGDPALGPAIVGSWANSMASFPAEWQLRFMAYFRLLQTRPWLIEKLRALYRLRRGRLVSQFQKLHEQQALFDRVHIGDDATVYNWSRLLPGVDAFSFFEKTGIAGVPGSGFGYTEAYVRFSIGVIPVPDPSEAPG